MKPVLESEESSTCQPNGGGSGGNRKTGSSRSLWSLRAPACSVVLQRGDQSRSQKPSNVPRRSSIWVSGTPGGVSTLSSVDQLNPRIAPSLSAAVSCRASVRSTDWLSLSYRSVRVVSSYSRALASRSSLSCVLESSSYV